MCHKGTRYLPSIHLHRGPLCTHLVSCTYKRTPTTRSSTWMLTERPCPEINLAVILPRDYPRWIVRAIDGSSIGTSVPAGGFATCCYTTRSCNTLLPHACIHTYVHYLRTLSPNVYSIGESARVRCYDNARSIFDHLPFGISNLEKKIF